MSNIKPREKRKRLNEAIERGDLDKVKELLEFIDLLSTVKNRKTNEETTDPNTGEDYKFELLSKAVKLKHLDVVKLLLEQGFNVNKKGQISPGLSPLLEAAIKMGQADLVECLLEAGAEKFDALSCACNSESLSIIKLLLERGMKVNRRDSAGTTPLQVAVKRKNSKLIDYLLACGAKPDSNERKRSAIHDAAHFSSIKVIQKFLDHGAKVDSRDEHGRTALHHAIKRGSVKTVTFLLDHGANVFCDDDDGRNAFSFAVFHVCTIGIKVLMLLLNPAKYPARIIHHYVVCALQMAAEKGKVKLVRVILKLGIVNPREQFNSQFTLQTAAATGNKEILKMLLDYGYDVNATGIRGITAILLALKGKHDEGVIKFLLDHGADVTAVLNDSETTLHIAADYGNVKVVQLLLNKGVDINATDLSGKTALHRGFYGINAEEIVLLLMDCGANLNIEDNNGKTVAHLILESGEENLSRRFIKKLSQLKGNGVAVSESIVNLLKGDRGVKNYFNQCEKEMRAMKRQKFDKTDVTLLKLMETKSLRKLTAYARNVDIMKLLESCDFQLKYPVYGSTVRDHIANGKMRQEMLDQIGVKRFFNRLVDKNGKKLPNLPLVCTSEILSYLSNNDLSSLNILIDYSYDYY